MKKQELAKRYILFIISLFFSGLGVAITKHGNLGVSPISSVANVMSIKIPALTLGTWLLIWNTILLLGQIVILRKNFQWIQLLQIPLSVLFAWFTDLGMTMVKGIPTNLYIVRILCVFVGTSVLGFGISLAVTANVIMNSGEAFVKAISDTIEKPFGNVKICFDVSCVLMALIMSLCMFDMKIVGSREGTIIAAFGTGLMVKFFLKRVKEPVNSMLEK